jgi:hypothetical protein
MQSNPNHHRALGQGKRREGKEALTGQSGAPRPPRLSSPGPPTANHHTLRGTRDRNVISSVPPGEISAVARKRTRTAYPVLLWGGWHGGGGGTGIIVVSVWV